MHYPKDNIYPTRKVATPVKNSRIQILKVLDASVDVRDVALRLLFGPVTCQCFANVAALLLPHFETEGQYAVVLVLLIRAARTDMSP